MLKALENPEAKKLIETIEDCLASWNGQERYESIIKICIAEIKELTGWEYSL